MKGQNSRKAQSVVSSGFTLLELLVVLFLLSLGYVSLYSAGLGKDQSVDSVELSKQEFIAAIRYARNFAVASGRPIAVKIDNQTLALTERDLTTAVESPFDRKDYTVKATAGYNFKTDEIAPVTGNTQDTFYFDNQGRLTSSKKNGTLTSLKAPISISYVADKTKPTAPAVELLVISNVTGELLVN